MTSVVLVTRHTDLARRILTLVCERAGDSLSINDVVDLEEKTEAAIKVWENDHELLQPDDLEYVVPVAELREFMSSLSLYTQNSVDFRRLEELVSSHESSPDA